MGRSQGEGGGGGIISHSKPRENELTRNDQIYAEATLIKPFDLHSIILCLFVLKVQFNAISSDGVSKSIQLGFSLRPPP